MTERAEATRGSGMTGFLVRRLLDADRGADEPFTVAELRRSLLPYPRCRTALGLASKAEYDVALLRLLHEGGLLESDDPELEEEVQRELESPEPALGVLDDHAATVLRPGPRLGRELRADAPPSAAGSASGAEAGTDGAGDAGAARVVSSSSAARSCAACGGGLPDAEGVRFCPHCGEGLEALRCGECGGEMAAGWRYCPFCGSERHA